MTRETLYYEFLGFWTRSSSSSLVEKVLLFFWISNEGTHLNRQGHIYAQCGTRNCGIFSSFICDSPFQQCCLQSLNAGIDAILDWRALESHIVVVDSNAGSSKLLCTYWNSCATARDLSVYYMLRCCRSPLISECRDARHSPVLIPFNLHLCPFSSAWKFHLGLQFQNLSSLLLENRVVFGILFSPCTIKTTQIWCFLCPGLIPMEDAHAR